MANQRFQTHTVASEGVELDDNYQKMVADIEEQTQRSGWLFGRGAFDKADLQYLRDFNNSLRYKEVEIEDKERELWERERARLEAEAEAALTRRPSAGSGGGGGGAVAGAGPSGGGGGLKGPPGLAHRPAPLLLQVKVKPGGSKQQQGHAVSPGAADQPDSCKRLKTEVGTPAALSEPGGVLTLPAARSEPMPTAGSCGMQQAGANATLPGNSALGQLVTRQASAPAVAVPAAGTAAGAGAAGRVVGRDGAAAGGGGLATLLGGYGSDDDDEDGSGEGEGVAGRDGRDDGTSGGVCEGDEAKAQVHEGRASGGAKPAAGGGPPGAALPPPVGLMSPEELLADPRVIAEGLLATRPAPQAVQGGDAWESGESEGSDSD